MGEGVRIAQRLADYVVLAHDPAVKSQAVDFWEISAPHYQSVVQEILARAPAAVRQRLEALAREPASASAYWAFADAVTVTRGRLLRCSPEVQFLKNLRQGRST